MALRNQVVLVFDDLVNLGLDHVIGALLFESDAGHTRVGLLLEVHEPLQVEKVFHHVVLIQVVLKLYQIFIDFVQDVFIFGLSCLLV